MEASGRCLSLCLPDKAPIDTMPPAVGPRRTIQQSHLFMAENTVQLDVSRYRIGPNSFIFIEAPKYLLEFLHINGTIAYYPVIILILTLIE